MRRPIIAVLFDMGRDLAFATQGQPDNESSQQQSHTDFEHDPNHVANRSWERRPRRDYR